MSLTAAQPATATYDTLASAEPSAPLRRCRGRRAALALAGSSALALLVAAAGVSYEDGGARAGKVWRMFKGDLGLPDCGIDTAAVCEPLPHGLYGMRRTDQVNGGECVGIDGKQASHRPHDESWYAACHSARSGKWDCGAPDYCKHGGFGVDGADKCICVCPWGWEGSTCENEINECRENQGDKGYPVCDPQAECFNTDWGYRCTCREGLFGDGYQRHQDKVRFGSILTSAGTHGWLERRDAVGTPGGNIVGYGYDDTWGCNKTPGKPKCYHGTLDNGVQYQADFGGGPPAGAPQEVIDAFEKLRREAKRRINKCASCDEGYTLDASDYQCYPTEE